MPRSGPTTNVTTPADGSGSGKRKRPATDPPPANDTGRSKRSKNPSLKAAAAGTPSQPKKAPAKPRAGAKKAAKKSAPPTEVAEPAGVAPVVSLTPQEHEELLHLRQQVAVFQLEKQNQAPGNDAAAKAAKTKGKFFSTCRYLFCCDVEALTLFRFHQAVQEANALAMHRAAATQAPQSVPLVSAATQPRQEDPPALPSQEPPPPPSVGLDASEQVLASGIQRTVQLQDIGELDLNGPLGQGAGRPSSPEGPTEDDDSEASSGDDDNDNRTFHDNGVRLVYNLLLALM